MVARGMLGCWRGMQEIRQDTVNEQAVRILLECILVKFFFPFSHKTEKVYLVNLLKMIY